MSEKQQHTAEHTCEKMHHRYDDGLRHKHNKSHLVYRQHARSHAMALLGDKDEWHPTSVIHEPTGQCRKINLRKVRKRFDKGRYH